MREIFKMNVIKITENKSLKESNIVEDKKDQHSTTLFLDANEKEIKNYSYYVKKIQESKTNNESNKYLKKLIFNHLKLE